MTQKEKTKFRSTSKWKKFRNYMKKLSDGIDVITNKPLYKGWNLHHCDLNPDNYTDLSKEDNFVCLNKGCHEVVHYLYTYYRKDKHVLDRLQEVLDRMVQLSGVENV